MGCFAGRETLSRVARNMVERYALGGWEEAPGVREPVSEGFRALRDLICGRDRGPAGDGTGYRREDSGPEAVAGFFLAFEGRQLRLSIFRRRGRQACRTYTACLDELVRARQRRLH
jgi:hypothetical protein